MLSLEGDHMNRKRKLLATIAGGALVAGSLALTGATPSGAAEVEVTCSADDSVQQGLGTLNGTTIAPDSQSVLNLIGSQQVPPIPAPVSLTNPLAGSVDPASVPPGSSPIEVTVDLLLSSELLDGLEENGVTTVDLSNMDVTVAAGDGVTGPDQTLSPPDTALSLASPDFPSASGTETYDVTAGIGETVTWDLVEASVGVHVVVPPSETIPGTVELTFGLSCTQSSSGDFISAIVLPPVVEDGPVVDPLSATTDEDTPVEIDLNEGISDGPFETDYETLAIIGDPSNGTAVLGDNGIVTYTPAAGFFGEDQFAYEVCTIDVVEPTTTEIQPPEGQDRAARERFCNSNVVTVTVNEIGDQTPTTTPTTDPGDPTPPPAAQPQAVPGNFTG
jgi:hypothetical protein